MTGFLAAPRPLIVFLAIFVLGACAQTGDLGRSRQLSAFGMNGPLAANENEVRTLSLTIEETGMRNKIENFVSRMQERLRNEAMRQAVPARSGTRPVPEDYYIWLRQQGAATPAGLYGKILNDIEIDLISLPAVFSAICAVNEIDRRRAIAITGLSAPIVQMKAAQEARRLENRQINSRFVTALAFHHASYVLALEQLLVDAPYAQARQIDTKIAELAAKLETARASRYCLS